MHNSIIDSKEPAIDHHTQNTWLNNPIKGAYQDPLP
jgi:hypothetical protein